MAPETTMPRVTIVIAEPEMVFVGEHGSLPFRRPQGFSLTPLQTEALVLLTVIDSLFSH